jgi:Leucine-rich repeat (LRR) protein
MNRSFFNLLLIVVLMTSAICTTLLAQTTPDGKASLQTVPASPYKSRKNQVQVPVYRSAKDSVRLAEAEALFTRLVEENTSDLKRRDSVEARRNQLREEAILRYRTVYSPSTGFIMLDSLRPANRRTVTQLSISNKTLSMLPAEVFLCDSLQHLELVNCSIRRLQKQLNKLTRLATLTILNNRGKRRLLLTANHQLTTLAIHGDNPATLPRSYKKLKALKTLDLSAHVLTRIPRGARRNRELRELNLQGNEITLKRHLPAYPQLEKLALQRNLIRKVPAAIKRFPNLIQLSLNNNFVSDIAPEIGTLRKLEYLSLYNNQLSSVPAGLFGLRKLKIIDLYFNHIEALDNRIANWSQLQILFVSHNRLYTLPSATTSLASLQEIHAYDNRLTQLPADIDKLAELRILNVQDNFIQNIPPALLKLTLLEELDLSRNFITQISLSVFDYPNLKILSLRNNPWTETTRQALREKSMRMIASEVHVNLTDMAGR